MEGARTPSTGRAPDRILGRIRGTEEGPTLVVVGALHGNEPAGVVASERVVRELELEGGVARGEVVALVGNRAALARGRRFLDVDLNRIWDPPRAGEPGTRGPPASEELEREELAEELSAISRRARGEVFVLDLHTTSGEGGPFLAFGDTLRNRAFATRFPAPLVLGLEELVEGTLLQYLDERGHVSVTFESGSHQDPRSPDRAEEAIWVALADLGILAAGKQARARHARSNLARETRDLPRAVEMRYRFPVPAEGGFRMRPGMANFQPVRAGDPLARVGETTVRAAHDGLLLMPLYQDLGSDGFFLVRRFHPFWLRLSALVRRGGLDRVVHWLPGVRRDGERREMIRVDRHVARWFALEVFHLLGFRRVGEDGRELVLVRRRHDSATAGRGEHRRGSEEEE